MRQPWLIDEEVRVGLFGMLMLGKLDGDSDLGSAEKSQARANGVSGRTVNAGIEPVDGSVVVVSLNGIIVPNQSMFAGAALDLAEAYIEEAVADSGVGAVVLNIDSPGGVALGVKEFASSVRKMSQQKPIYSIANHDACSAAYYAGSAATKMFATPSSRTGSVGVYRQHFDYSKMLEEIGITHSIVKAGDNKAEGLPYEPLSDEARAYWQEQVDEIYEEFTSDVAAFRGVSREHVLAHFGQGRDLRSKQALQVGMIDGIMTMNELISSLVTDNEKRFSVDQLRRQDENRRKRRSRASNI